MLVIRVCGHLVDELRDLGGGEGGEQVLQVDVGRRKDVATEVHRARHLDLIQFQSWNGRKLRWGEGK